ncbi:MAG: thioredoxin family protein [Candidatus Moranbacteria bacterium]|nr:thioredoxin family protein [Candidatus Moranbacteria bacterium]
MSSFKNMKVIKFGAVWCSGCLVMKPRWKEIEDNNSWLKTEYYDFDSNKEMVEKYNIDETLPTFIFLDKNEKEFLRLSGEVEKEKLEKILNENKEK